MHVQPDTFALPRQQPDVPLMRFPYMIKEQDLFVPQRITNSWTMTWTCFATFLGNLMVFSAIDKYLNLMVLHQEKYIEAQLTRTHFNCLN